MNNFDAAVIGAGPAGIAATAAAARAGLRTVLLEKEPFIGGIPVKGHMTTLCGMYRIPAGSNVPEILYEGVPRDFVRLLTDLDGTHYPIPMGKSYVLLYRPESFSAAAGRLLEDGIGPEVFCSAEFIGVGVSGNRIESITVFLKGGRRHRIRIGAVIDATGDAAVCRAAGAPLILPDETSQAPAIIFPLYRVDAGELSGVAWARWHMMIQRGIKDGALPPQAGSLSFLPSPDTRMIQVKLNLGSFMRTSPGISREKLAEKANDLRGRLISFFRDYIGDFNNCTTIEGASPVLNRESQRGRGEYVLSQQDVLSARKAHDAAATACWPVEKWDENGNFSVFYPAEEGCYDIPKQCLKSIAFKNLFMAGKTISADSGAIASARVIGCCLATGRAAAELAADSI